LGGSGEPGSVAEGRSDTTIECRRPPGRNVGRKTGVAIIVALRNVGAQIRAVELPLLNRDSNSLAERFSFASLTNEE